MVFLCTIERALYSSFSLPMLGKKRQGTFYGHPCWEVFAISFLSERMRGEPVPCRGGTDGDFHLFRECTSPSSLFISGRILNSLHWPLRTRVLGLDLCFGTVGCLVFLVMLAFPWALSDADVALDRLDAALGGYPPDLWCT